MQDIPPIVENTSSQWSSSPTAIHSRGTVTPTPRLVSPTQIICVPKYVLWRMPGAHSHIWVQEEVHERLLRVDARIRAATNGKGRLCIWDGLRSMETQIALFEAQRARIDREWAHLQPYERKLMLEDIVRPPRYDLPPPHTTGGAVDVTIWIDGRDDALGSFDDFTPKGRSDYYASVAPELEADKNAAVLRTILRDCMIAEDFEPIQSEWWHFEYKTAYWAEKRKTVPRFDSIREAPDSQSPALRKPPTPPRFVESRNGVAQVFATPGERSLSLQKIIDGHYYARTRHPGERALSAQFCHAIGAEDGILFPSGLSAALTAIWGSLPRGGRLLVDQYTYYETLTSVHFFAPERQWTIVSADLSDPRSLEKLQLESFDVIFCDHPRNWLLTSPNLFALHTIADAWDAKLIVDTSLQPLQRLPFLKLADLVTVSFSKYPSAGLTCGGGVFGAKEFLEPIRKVAAMQGSLMAPDTASEILCHLPSLEDRLAAISAKAERLVAFLRGQPAVQDVRLPDLRHVDAVPGGQVTFLVEPELAEKMEMVIAANTLDPQFPFAFACTFGALFTTLEHFDSRNSDGKQPSRGSDHIEPGRIRIGVGHENIDVLIDNLRIVLAAAIRA